MGSVPEYPVTDGVGRERGGSYVYLLSLEVILEKLERRCRTRLFSGPARDGKCSRLNSWSGISASFYTSFHAR